MTKKSKEKLFRFLKDTFLPAALHKAKVDGTDDSIKYIAAELAEWIASEFQPKKEC